MRYLMKGNRKALQYPGARAVLRWVLFFCAIPTALAGYEEIRIIDEQPRNGVYDPSVEYGSDSIGWMSYSPVIAGKGSRVHTHIAKTTDRGRTWTFDTAVNKSVAGTVQLKGGKQVHGAWWNEVSTLVYDPQDPGREWKLFWHKYFSKLPHKGPKHRVLSHGWIAYRYAPHPSGPWSEEISLFGVGPFPLKPYSARIDLRTLDPELRKYIVLTEPGAMVKDGVLYLALQAVHKPLLGKPKHDIILISSRNHGNSWKYLGRLLQPRDAKKFTGDHFTGASLVTEGSRVFLFVTPGQNGRPLTGHRGLVIFEFENINRGQLKRSKNGEPAVIKHLKPELAKGGQSDYHEKNTYGGIVMPQFDLANLPQPWRLFNTRENISGKH